MWKVQPLQGAHCAVEPWLAGARRPEQCDNTLLFQMNSLKTENSCLGLCGGRVTESSRTKSPQTAKALCKEEYTAIYFLFFLFSAFCAAVGSINTSFFFIENQPFVPKEPWMVAWAFSEFWMFGFLQQRRKMKENFSSSSEGSSEGCV